MPERRSSPRVALVAQIELAGDCAPVLRQITDVSHGGVFVRTRSPLREGLTVRVQFALPGQDLPMALEATVAWARPHVGMGLRFTKIAPADRRAIDEFLAAALGPDLPGPDPALAAGGR